MRRDDTEAVVMEINLVEEIKRETSTGEEINYSLREYLTQK
jgi:hypothetical protein